MAVTAATRESIIDLVTIAYDSSAGTALLNELVALSEAGQTLKQIANYIADSSTYKAIYPPFLTNQEWATAFVNVILEETSSAGKSEGVNLIVSFLNAGSTRGDILWEASAYLAAPTSAADPVFGSAARAFNNITEVSTYYTVILNLDGTLSQRQAAVENVSSDPVTVTEAKAAADVVADPLYTLSVDSPTLVEPSAGTRVLTYTLTLNKAATETVSINYNTLTSGTASAGNDFLADSGVVTFAAGQTTAAVGVTVNADTTFEASETVQIQFTGSQLSSSVTATGTITDANVAPVITSGATGSVAENADIATVIYTAAASDADAGDTQVYSLKAGGDAAMLDINSATGAVSLKASADFETKNAYSFTIVATDQGGLTSEKAVTAGVTDVNEAPVVSSGATGTVAENAVASTVVYTATVSDVDAGDTHTFSLKAGGDAAMLSIDAATGAVTLNASADFETKAAYDFTVVATDKAGLAGEKAVTVSVTDANDAPVITSGATGSVAENAAIATVIYTAAATDQDGGDTPAFSLKAGDDAALLDIDSTTGAVTLKASANFEAKASYGFTVVATDKAGASAEQAVVAAVTDVNEAPTGLADTSATSDNTTVTISVLANDSDPDAGDVLSVASVTQGSNGTVAIVGDKVTYTPNSTFLNGTDTFTYIAQDSGGLQTAAQTVSV
ncbi:MAG: cadherin domain-containing protein, partial [Pseudohongiellaceae bacterium]